DDLIGHGRINAYQALKYTVENYGGTFDQDVIIAAGETFNLQPGITLKFTPGTGLIVYGTLNVNGQQGNSATFTRSGTIAYATIEHTTKGIDVRTSSPYSVTVDNCTIQNFTEQGIYVINEGEITVQDCLIQAPAGGSHGIYLAGKYNVPVVSGTTIKDVPIGIERINGPGAALLYDNTIRDCTTGIKTNLSSPEIYNSYLHTNT
ncbi:MAG: right-handed parallel beta-helix repeat-containing protein, partial [Gammaproteobacteria bacterium]|nr:right-handed parallel beta-helix repeat-containing protein [Gammaproteobacteria bacterium]